ADNHLRLALAVTVSRVDKIDARIQSFVDNPNAVVVVGVAHRAEHHRAEAISADLDASSSKCAILHSHSPWSTARYSERCHTVLNYLSGTTFRIMWNIVPFVKWRHIERPTKKPRGSLGVEG